jgi:tRNA threonylcarbamoyladenosine biosynthesis protein TsaB
MTKHNPSLKPKSTCYLLVIDTAHSRAQVALARDKKVLAQRQWSNDQYVGRKLITALDDILQEHSLTIKDIRRVAVHVGPGGYSSLRAGVVAAQMIALAAGIELVAVTSQDCMSMLAAAWQAKPVMVIRPKY